MYLKKVDGPRTVTLPDGSTMSRADLPPITTVRWVASRKAAVVKGVAAGLISAEEAQAMYDLSEEELAVWMSRAAEHGEKGLKTTNTKRYRA
ncbi:MAG: CtrA inhibitor SciP [Shimia sp.]